SPHWCVVAGMNTRTASVGLALALPLLIAAPASADIVKAPTGEKSIVKLASTTSRALKRAHVTVTALKPGTKSGATFSFPYNLARWDFAARDGDVAHFTKTTGIRFRRGHRSVSLTHPRVVMDSPTRGYVTALVSNDRFKAFTVSASKAKVTDTGAA